MDSNLQEPLFKPLLCRSRVHEHSKRPFAPVEHDLIVLNYEGDVQIAKNASVRQIINFLTHSNNKFAAVYDEERGCTTPLTVLRFDEADPAHETPSGSIDDWSQLWPFFDSCCKDKDNTIDFVTRLRHADAQCQSSVSKNVTSSGPHDVECTKISYNVNFPDKHTLIVHHFHKIKGEVKEMVRMVTCGISEESIEKILCKALPFLSISSSDSDNGSPGGIMSPTLIPHPKAIICGMLERLEDLCREKLQENREWIEKIEADINDQRDPITRKPKGLEINYVKLGETSIRLGEVRQKLQHLLSSISFLEEIGGLPTGCMPSLPTCNKQPTRSSGSNTPEGRLYNQWGRQLREVRIRLLGLKGMAQQHNSNIENLQERVKGILSIVSILLAEKENEWSHQALDKRQQTSEYQVAIIEYQVKMLKQQELIASRTKRDNTVMKVIAVLTSLFLPGTFVATVFSVPIFKWDERDPRGPHFMTYWYFTAPITTTLVVGFSLWFVKMWYDDRQVEKRRAKVEMQDLEKISRFRK